MLSKKNRRFIMNQNVSLTGQNAVQCKIVIEPRDLTFVGPNTDTAGLGIFAPATSPEDSRKASQRGEKTKSLVAYTVGIKDNYDPQVLDLRIANERVHSFNEKFIDSEAETKAKLFFTKVEEGKRRLMSEYGNIIPAQAVRNLVISLKPFNVGRCYRVHLVLNRHSTLPFKGAKLTKAGDYARTDRTKTFWITTMPTEEELVKMTEYLKLNEEPEKTSNHNGDFPVYAEIRESTRDGKTSTVRLFTSASGKLDGIDTQSEDRVRRSAPTRR
jgi:hypothetical protein